MQTQTATITEPRTPPGGNSEAALRIMQIARTCLSTTGNDVEEATAVMVEMLSDEDTLQAVIDDAIKLVCETAVGAAMRRERAQIVRATMRYALPNGRQRAAAFVSSVSMSMLDFPLAGGQRLGAAVRSDVERQAALYEEHASDMSHKARWLRRIAERMPEGRAVGDVLDEATVTAMFREASHA